MAPRSEGLAMIATRIGNLELAAPRSSWPSRTCWEVETPASAAKNSGWYTSTSLPGSPSARADGATKPAPRSATRTRVRRCRRMGPSRGRSARAGWPARWRRLRRRAQPSRPRGATELNGSSQRASPCAGEVRSCACLQGEWRREVAPADVGQQEQAPGPGFRQEHADMEHARAAGAAGDPGGTQDRGAVAGARAADVGVEVVQRALMDEDRVRERAPPAFEHCQAAARTGDADGEECGLDRF